MPPKGRTTCIMAPKAGSYNATRLVGLQRHAAARRAETVQRLQKAIDELTALTEPITMEAIERISGLRYSTIKRNDEARRLWEQHSPYHQAKRTDRTPRDPLLSMSRADLIAVIRTAREQREEMMHALQVAKDART